MRGSASAPFWIVYVMFAIVRGGRGDGWVFGCGAADDCVDAFRATGELAVIVRT
jgi:hypothetical protein